MLPKPIWQILVGPMTFVNARAVLKDDIKVVRNHDRWLQFKKSPHRAKQSLLRHEYPQKSPNRHRKNTKTIFLNEIIILDFPISNYPEQYNTTLSILHQKGINFKLYFKNIHERLRSSGYFISYIITQIGLAFLARVFRRGYMSYQGEIRRSILARHVHLGLK